MSEIYSGTDLGLLYKGDSREVLKIFSDNYFDTIVTDCPYALEFMGSAWDKVLPAREIWEQCLRVAKPGAMMLVFGGDRTHHRLMVDIEDAGWEIRTCIYWLFGSGFPKSANISKQIDKMKGAERKVVGKHPAPCANINASPAHDGSYQEAPDITAPATPEAQLWDGWGTALKPAAEIIVVAMKPLDETFAENALKHGVAGLNIDGGRVGTERTRTTIKDLSQAHGNQFGKAGIKYPTQGYKDNPQGRWPSNLLLSHHPECCEIGVRKVKGSQGVRGSDKGNTMYGGGKGLQRPTTGQKVGYVGKDGTETVPAYECAAGCPCGHVWATKELTECPECGCRRCEWICAVKMLDEQAGELKSGGHKIDGKTIGKTGMFSNAYQGKDLKANSGGPSRFYYCAKSSRTERELGLKGHIPCVKCGNLDTFWHDDGEGGTEKCVRNSHPTVKPLAIMEYLCKLTLTPTNGTVLDPFAGSGTTLIACEKLNRNWIGIELSEENCEIAKHRINHINQHVNQQQSRQQSLKFTKDK